MNKRGNPIINQTRPCFAGSARHDQQQLVESRFKMVTGLQRATEEVKERRTGLL